MFGIPHARLGGTSVGLGILGISGLALALGTTPASAVPPVYTVSPTTIPVGAFPLGINLTPSGNELLVVNNNGQSLSVIDPATNAVSSTINLAGGSYPVALAFGSSASGLAWFTDAGRKDISSLDLATDVVTDYPTLQKPGELAITPNGDTAIATDYFSDTIEFFSLSSHSITQVVVGVSPEAVAITPDGTTAYVTTMSGSVSVVDIATETVIATIPLGGSPYGVTLTPNGTTAYVSDQNGDTVSVIDTTTNTVTGSITVGSSPAHITISPDGETAFVANRGTDTVSVIDLATNTVTDTITVGSGPWDTAFNAAGTKAYVTNDNDGTVSIISIGDPVVPPPTLPTTGIDPLPLTLGAGILLATGAALLLVRRRALPPRG